MKRGVGVAQGREAQRRNASFLRRKQVHAGSLDEAENGETANETGRMRGCGAGVVGARYNSHQESDPLFVFARR